MLGNLNGWHALILLAVVLLLFGAAKLPALARSVGQSVKILRKESSGDAIDPEPSAAASAPGPRAGTQAERAPQLNSPRE
ncbi:Twin-arginine translocation protein TatA [Microbacterium esteraromaticum]|uniref:Sec-independent protein translocase protein TatA n=1 Tax=Microbacterium esteraromaticum TaxID=57043 RepID=A0A1R4K0B7_9MICO|nr:twin-arginine translocase TatA/TatE family subunit [Microbacterium esteraromaticum]SJN37689.1 Twin-arginine translocation protein TatA [Microbacterium esteraromaticum]